MEQDCNHRQPKLPMIEIMDVLEEQLSQLSFQGATGWLNFIHSAAAAQTSIEILQIQNGQPVQIGLYDHTLNHLLLNRSVLGIIPSDTLNRIYIVYPIELTVLLALLVVLGFALTTISMYLFIYYRKQQAVRATSSTLSLCMFIGCYFLLTSSFFQDKIILNLDYILLLYQVKLLYTGCIKLILPPYIYYSALQNATTAETTIAILW